MSNSARTTDEIIVSRLEDGKQMKLKLVNMTLFAFGVFSNVYRGVAHTESNHRADIAIKKTWPRQKGVPLEVRILGRLNRLKHKNIVRLLYSYEKEHNGKLCLALIFEFLPLNLQQYLKLCDRKIDIVEVKLITWQLFRAQFHLQRMDICHRDVKPQNVLFDSDTGLLKLSDFGSSAIEARKSRQPSYHVTRYYRPPELLLGAKSYGSEIDIWSCGCVFGELLKGGTLLSGRSTTNQAELIMDAIGRPTTDDLLQMRANERIYIEILRGYLDTTAVTANFAYLVNQTNQMTRHRRTAVFNTYIHPPDMIESVELIRQILVYNPHKRLSGTRLLLNPYFSVLFSEDVKRMNGKPIGCLSVQDLDAVRQGDRTVTGESTEDV